MAVSLLSAYWRDLAGINLGLKLSSDVAFIIANFSMADLRLPQRRGCPVTTVLML